MPYIPVQLYGALPAYDRREFDETGLMTESVSFTPEVEKIEKKGHVPGAYGQVVHVQMWRGPLAIELKGGIIPNGQGVAVGLAAVYPGQAVTCVHFAAASESAAAVERHGFTRDSAKLLMVDVPKTELGEDIPAVTVPMRYYPSVDNALLTPAVQAA